jgi:hypothetical protein
LLPVANIDHKIAMDQKQITICCARENDTYYATINVGRNPEHDIRVHLATHIGDGDNMFIINSGNDLDYDDIQHGDYIDVFVVSQDSNTDMRQHISGQGMNPNAFVYCAGGIAFAKLR